MIGSKLINDFIQGNYGNCQLITEEVDSITYVGKAPYKKTDGTAVTKSDAFWNISRISVSGGTTEVKHANGDWEAFNNVWDDRATYNYTIG